MSLFNKIKSVFNSSSDDVPDAQTIYFKNGEMYKVYPTDKEQKDIFLLLMRSNGIHQIKMMIR